MACIGHTAIINFSDLKKRGFDYMSAAGEFFQLRGCLHQNNRYMDLILNNCEPHCLLEVKIKLKLTTDRKKFYPCIMS